MVVAVQKPFWSKVYSQILLLLWKRHTEISKNNWEYFRAIAPPVIFFILTILSYETLGILAQGAVEPFLVPLGFFVFSQRIVVQIMYEKSNRLQEAMKMMGLLDLSYWLGYFITEAIITGFVVSFLCSIVSAGGLFNGAGFGTILGILFVYCLAVVPFCFFLTCFFDTPQTAGQAALAVLFGKKLPLEFMCCYLIFVSLFRLLCGLRGRLSHENLRYRLPRRTNHLLLHPSHRLANRMWSFLEIIHWHPCF